MAEITVYGAPWCPDCKRSKKFLAEHRVPFVWVDIDDDPEGLRFVEELQKGGRTIPTIVFPEGDHLLEPSDGDLARRLGLKLEADRAAYDLAIVGGGPAGLAAAIYAAREGISALVVDRSGQHLYVANTSAVNTQSTAIGNISGFNINTTTGVLSPIPGSPFTSNVGSGPSTLVIDTEGNFLYATTPGSNYSVWCFEINSQTGSTDGQLTAVNGSPFSVVAGGLFALIDTKGSFLFIGDQNANGISAYTYDQNSGQPTVILNSPFSTGTAPGQMVFAD